METNYSNLFSTKQYSPTYEYSNVKRPGGGARLKSRRLAAPDFRDYSPNPIDTMMEGLDEESAQLTNKLKSIYDSYQSGLDTYNENMAPLLEGLENDLVGLNDWMVGYQDTLNELKPNFVGAVRLDPNATRYREEYVGNVAAQADAADRATRMDMASQGINPYANAGMNRQHKLERASAIAGASNQAYRDHRADYNADLAQEQDANARFADLYSMTGDHFKTAVNARTGISNIYSMQHNNGIQAAQNKAAGYEGLLGLNQTKRVEALELGKHHEAAQQNANALALNAYNSSNKNWEYING